ncbi:3-isopropylmalate dehydrogenase [Tothia fuscella]|uniref:3-isopropylmalate dehydrogenase n=1 Tax=Tothia fuscella TaxID=1048955 RepID=A0A9P4TTW0_9PEZI|nr:3-isopropylmalate dehydrogenase [Tothia fuscella]
MAQVHKILILPGDHAGPEVMKEALKVLSLIQSHTSSTKTFQHTTDLCGGISINTHQTPITDSVLSLAASSDAILFGSVGGPEWGTTYPNPESGLLRLRTHINAFANLRPCRFYSRSLVEKSPLKEHVIRGVDFMLVRENCGGAYFGDKVEDYENGIASDTWGYTAPEIERCARVAGALARQMGKGTVVTSADKANVLASGRLWRNTVTSVFEKEFKDVELRHQLADSLAMLLCTNPSKFNGVIVTDNTFGDILSDQAGGLVGTLGILPSASLCGVPEMEKGVKGLYEPVHGSAPDIAGQGKVNPVAQILSLSMMLRYSFCMYEEADAIDAAVEKVLDSKDIGGLEVRTGDLGGIATTGEVGDAVCKVLEELLKK